MVKALPLPTIVAFCAGAAASAAADPVVTGALGFSCGNNWRYIVDIINDIDPSGFGPADARWSPHLFVGIGAATLEIGRGSTETEFAGQAIAGMEYALSPGAGPWPRLSLHRDDERET